MPAPLARGLIFSISLLIAAGIAVYENPQVREWIDDNRRKIALSLHNLGDEISPRPRYNRSGSSEDASTREDDSPEAAERRRQVREEILQRAQILEEKRREKAGGRSRGISFDDMVDSEGRLHYDEKAGQAFTSAANPAPADEGLRKRGGEATGFAMGAAAADPFSDEMGMDFSEKSTELPPRPAEVSPELPPRPVEQSRESTATLQGEVLSPAPLAIDTTAASVPSVHGSEMLVDLTPTTSMAPSSFPYTAPDTPTSESENGLEHEDRAPTPPVAQHQSAFQSVHEWAEASTASFYSAPESEVSSFHGADSDMEGSIVEVSDSVSQADVLSQVDGMSERGNINTPGTWTEVGSVISDES